MRIFHTELEEIIFSMKPDFFVMPNICLFSSTKSKFFCLCTYLLLILYVNGVSAVANAFSSQLQPEHLLERGRYNIGINKMLSVSKYRIRIR